MKPVAWGMLDSEGGIYDSISPEEHDREEGAYTIPLYTYPAKTLTDEDIIETVKDHFIGAIKLGIVLTNDNVLEFARAILRKASEK